MNQAQAVHASGVNGLAHKAARGHSGRLFYESYESENTFIANASRTPLFPTPAAIRWKRLLETRARLLKLRGLHLYVLIAPDAHFIYRDEVPEHLVLPRSSPARQFCELFSGIDNLTLINPEDALIGARGGIDVYRTNDTHWSAYGAFVAYSVLMQHLPPSVPRQLVTAADVGYRYLRSYGDLGALVDPEVVADMPVACVRDGSARLVFNYAGEGRNGWKRFESIRGHGRAFVVRDSFATELSVFLNETFVRVDFLGATSRLHLEAIDEEKPDVVIWEIGERRLMLEETDHYPTTAYEIYAFDGSTPYGLLALEASACRAEGDLTKALQLAAEAARHPEAGPAYDYLHADLLLALDSHEESEVAIRRAIAQRDDRPAYWNLLSVVSRHRGNQKAATEASIRAVQLAPHNAHFVSDCGYNLLTAGSTIEAIECMSACREHVSDSPYLSYWLAMAYMRAGDLPLARKEAINAHLLLPENPQVFDLMWTIESSER